MSELKQVHRKEGTGREKKYLCCLSLILTSEKKTFCCSSQILIFLLFPIKELLQVAHRFYYMEWGIHLRTFRKKWLVRYGILFPVLRNRNWNINTLRNHTKIKSQMLTQYKIVYLWFPSFKIFSFTLYSKSDETYTFFYLKKLTM